MEDRPITFPTRKLRRVVTQEQALVRMDTLVSKELAGTSAALGEFRTPTFVQEPLSPSYSEGRRLRVVTRPVPSAKLVTPVKLGAQAAISAAPVALRPLPFVQPTASRSTSPERRLPSPAVPAPVSARVATPVSPGTTSITIVAVEVGLSRISIVPWDRVLSTIPGLSCPCHALWEEVSVPLPVSAQVSLVVLRIAASGLSPGFPAPQKEAQVFLMLITVKARV